MFLAWFSCSHGIKRYVWIVKVCFFGRSRRRRYGWFGFLGRSQSQPSDNTTLKAHVRVYVHHDLVADPVVRIIAEGGFQYPDGGHVEHHAFDVLTKADDPFGFALCYFLDSHILDRTDLILFEVCLREKLADDHL